MASDELHLYADSQKSQKISTQGAYVWKPGCSNQSFDYDVYYYYVGTNYWLRDSLDWTLTCLIWGTGIIDNDGEPQFSRSIYTSLSLLIETLILEMSSLRVRFAEVDLNINEEQGIRRLKHLSSHFSLKYNTH